MSTQRIKSIRSRLHPHIPLARPHNHRTTRNRPLLMIPAFQKDQENMAEIKKLYLVTQRKSLEAQVSSRFVRWLLLRIYKHYGFAARDTDGKSYFQIEYRGAFTDPAYARWLASTTGGAVKPIPLDAALPEETVQYDEPEEVPYSEVAHEYRRSIRLPFVAISRDDFEALEATVTQTLNCAQGKCAPKVV